MRLSKPINLFLPDKLIVDLERYLLENRLNYKTDKMCFYYIIHYLTIMQIRNKKKSYFYLNKKEINLITNCNSDKYIRTLKKGGFIDCDNDAKPGFKSYHYRLSAKYHSSVSKFELLPNSSVYQNIIKYNNRKKAHYNRLEPHLKEMWNVLRKLEIDYDGALNWIVNNATESQLLPYLTSLEHLKDKRFRYLNRNKTNSRLDTNVTNLKSEIRQFFIGDFVSIDLKNSQPFLLGALLNHLNFHKGTLCWLFSDEVLIKTFGLKAIQRILLVHQNQEKADLVNLSSYTESVNKGQLYDDFIHQFNGDITRKKVKEIMFQVLFSRNEYYQGFKKITPFKREKAIFSKVYPTVYEIITQLKKKDHRNLPIFLQRVESYLFIDCITKELVKNGILPITIHDSVLIQRKDTAIALSIIQNVFDREIGIIPEFKIDRILS